MTKDQQKAVMDAYATLQRSAASMAERLVAHATILDNSTNLDDTVRLDIIAKALSDLCLSTAVILANQEALPTDRS